jgi:hypothetical protein
MPKVFDVVKAAGSYTDRSGNEKTRWINCGMIVKNPQSGKLSLRLDVVPVGVPTDSDVGMWFALMEPRQQGDMPPQNTSSKTSDDNFAENKDIPF